MKARKEYPNPNQHLHIIRPTRKKCLNIPFLRPMPSSSRARISNTAFVFCSKGLVQCLLLLEQRSPPLSATHRTFYIPNFPNIIKVHQSQTALKTTTPLFVRKDCKFTSRESSRFRIPYYQTKAYASSDQDTKF